jgi:hypothetical protein
MSYYINRAQDDQGHHGFDAAVIEARPARDDLLAVVAPAGYRWPLVRAAAWAEIDPATAGTPRLLTRREWLELIGPQEWQCRLRVVGTGGGWCRQARGHYGECVT